MDNRSSKPTKRAKKEHDFATIAYRVVQEATAKEEAAPVEPTTPEPTPEELRQMAVALGRAGGKKGGKARAAKLTPEQRSEIAKKAAAKRWADRDDT